MADREVKIVYKITDEGSLRVLDDIARRAGVVGEVVDTSTRRAGDGLGRFQASIITANQAMGLLRTAADAVRQVIEGVTTSIGRVDSYGELAKAVGLTVEELTSMRVAAKQGGLELGELGRSVAFLQKQIVAAAGGGGKLTIFESLGLSQRDLQAVQDGTRSTVDLLGELGRAFEGLSRAEQVATARELFGRGGGRILNVLNDNLGTTIARARELGAVVGEDMADAADEAANAMDDLSVATESLQEAIGVGLAPLVREAATQTTAWVAANRELISAELSTWANGVADILRSVVIPALGDVNAAANATADVINTLIYNPKSSALLLTPGARRRIAEGELAGVQTERPTSLPPLGVGGFSPAEGGFSPAGFDDLAVGTPLGGSGGGGRSRVRSSVGGGGGGRSSSDRQVDRQRLEEEQRILEALTERERVRVALAEQTVALRDAAVRRAREDLDLAKSLDATEDEQLALAQRMDDLERQRLAATRERIQTELDGLLQFGPAISQQVVELQTQLYLVDEQLARAPQYAERMRQEFERSRDVLADLGDSLADSLTRVVDGILAGGGTFGSLANNIVNIGFTTASTFAGQAIKGINVGNLFKDVGSLFTGGEGGGEILSTDTLSNLGAAAATYGASVALDIAVNGQARVNELFRNSNLLRQTLSRGDIAYAAGGGGLVGGIGRAVLEYGGNGFIGHFDPISMALSRSSLFQAPTGGTQRAMALDRLLNRLGLPQQGVYGIDENGIRAQFLTNAPNAASAAAFAAAGFGFDIPGLRQPTIEALVTPGRNGATYAHSPNRVGAMLDLLESGAAQRPGVEALRTNEALGLGLVLTAGTRRGINVANLLTNNLLLTGVSEGEARRQLRKIAESQGVTLESGIEEAQRLFIERRLRDNPATAQNEAQQQLFTAVEGLVGLFQDDIPAGVDVAALALTHFTEQAGIDVDAFNAKLERSLEIFGALQSSAEQGLRAGLGAGISAFGQRNALIAGGGAIADIIKANRQGREQIVSALFENISTGLSTAITEGVYDAVKDSAAWTALTEAIADAVGGANIADLPALIGDVVTTALPALNAAAETVAQIQAVIGVTPTSLRGRATTIAGGITDRRYAQLSPTQQDRYLRGELARIDARLATPGVGDEERRRLLDERADIAFRGADLAASRYTPGSAAANRAVNEWLLVADTTRQQFEAFANEQVSQIDALKANTDALNRVTDALTTRAPGGLPNLSMPATNTSRSPLIENTIANYLNSPQGRRAVKNAAAGK